MFCRPVLNFNIFSIKSNLNLYVFYHRVKVNSPNYSLLCLIELNSYIYLGNVLTSNETTHLPLFSFFNLAQLNYYMLILSVISSGCWHLYE